MSHQPNTQSESPSSSTRRWQTLDQLADAWGMDLDRARLVVGALMDSGRIEEEARPRRGLIYRLVI